MFCTSVIKKKKFNCRTFGSPVFKLSNTLHIDVDFINFFLNSMAYMRC